MLRFSMIVFACTLPYSGSSVLAQMLNDSGFRIPLRRWHYEPLAFLNLNDKVIRCNVKSQNEGSAALYFKDLHANYGDTRVVLKDPEFSEAYSKLKDVLPDNSLFLINIRNPLKIAEHMADVKQEFLGLNRKEALEQSWSEIDRRLNNLVQILVENKKAHIIEYEELLINRKWKSNLAVFLGTRINSSCIKPKLNRRQGEGSIPQSVWDKYQFLLSKKRSYGPEYPNDGLYDKFLSYFFSLVYKLQHIYLRKISRGMNDNYWMRF